MIKIIKVLKRYLKYRKEFNLISDSDLFDKEYYLITYPDVKNADVDALVHYIKSGAIEGRNPSNSFDSKFYLNEYIDVNNSRFNPLVHYIMYGQKEGRFISHFQKVRTIIEQSNMFDEDYYYATYHDVKDSGVNALTHYIRHGANEGRNPSPLFDTLWYMERYSDVVKLSLNPLYDYIKFGIKQGREPQSSNVLVKNVKDKNYLNPYFGGNIKKINGKVERVRNSFTVLLCAHVAGQKLFGGERSLVDIIDGLNYLGFNVFVSLPNGSSQNYLEVVLSKTVRVIQFNYKWWGKNVCVSENTIRAFSSIIVSEEIDAVHVNTIMLREPILAAKSMCIPAAVHVRELIKADKDLCDYLGETSKDIIEYVVSQTDFIIANSQATKNSFLKSGATFVVPNTVDVNKFNIKNIIEDEIVNIVLISSNIPKKGIHDFVKIAKMLNNSISNARFLLIGPINAHTIKLKNEGVPSNFEFYGYCEPIEALTKANIVLNLSNFQESFGRTVLEAMAASCPVVAYDWGALPELIVNNKTGYLVPLGDISLVAKRIKHLCDNHSLIVTMGKRAREIAVKKYSLNVYANHMQLAYKHIIKLSDSLRSNNATRVMHSALYNKSPKSKKLNIAYFLWHFPVPSETFVLNELRILINKGHNVRVFCCQSPYNEFKPDIPIVWEKVNNSKDLAIRLKNTSIDIVHSHFIYPTVTNMVWPACEIAKIPFTFIAHSQDIFRHTNIRDNNIKDVTKSEYCKYIFVPSRFHMKFVLEQGVPKNKVCINPNGIDPYLYQRLHNKSRINRPFRSICAIHRFVEKKGLKYLIEAAKNLSKHNIKIHIYGYGELQSQYESIIKENKIENVNLHGPVNSREEMLTLFETHDLFVCPSIRASDGDMDGIPTVLMEAMANGLPVLTTGISGIPDLVQHDVDGFICDGSVDGIKDAICYFYDVPDEHINSVIEAAKLKINNNFNVNKLTKTLLRYWSNETIDIMIVSWNNLTELEEVIKRIYIYTSTPFHLIVCDNASEKNVRDFLSTLCTIKNNVTVIFNNENVKVGPGTNITMEHSYSKYSIYVCGKEGFILNYGWENSIIEYMDSNSNVGLAGTLGYSPSYLYGKQYANGVAEFPNFRNKDFAEKNGDRKFFHVQGGFFVLRRAMYDEIGGYSQKVPHNYTDVEYSYYVESCKWEIGSIPNILALYNKTCPDIYSRIDENISAIHPPTLQELSLLDNIVQKKVVFCNLCRWYGEKFDINNSCLQCESAPKDRTLYRFIAETDLTYQRHPSIAINLGSAIKTFWAEQFQGCIFDMTNDSYVSDTNSMLNYAASSMRLIYIDIKEITEEKAMVLIKKIVLLLHNNGILVVRTKYNDNIVGLISSEFSLEHFKKVRYNSSVVKYDSHNLFVFRKY